MKDTTTDRIPKHIAIIMDGNGRWAKKRHLPRTMGHREGVKRVDEIVEAAGRMKIEILTLYAFSTENWSRPNNEVSFLMDLMVEMLRKKLKKLQDNNVRLQMIGRRDNVPASVLSALDEVMAATKNNSGLILNLAFNYGARQEIIDAFQRIAQSVQSGELNAEQIGEETIDRALYTKDLPDPDLLIRTSGEQRISNFLLWQLSYAELYFTSKLWPEFTIKELEKAVVDFQNRERRYGDVIAAKG
jgi:undecaprenyl diphosphate synthase